MCPPTHRRFALAAVFLAFAGRVAAVADDNAPDWLRGAGPNLEVRLQGEILDDGQPAIDPQLECHMIGAERVPNPQPTLDGHRFEVWIPVNSADSFSVLLDASSAHTNHVACRQLGAFELRQAAIDGVPLSLATPTKQKRFLVQHDGQPVAGAEVKIEFGYKVESRATTDSKGVAMFELLPSQEITQVTAWTPDHRIGGFSFDREPSHDPRDDEFTVELSRCRDQLFRFVDEAGAPVANVEATIQVATPAPDYNYLGTNEHSQLRSNAAGEVVYPWFPDWDKHHFYVDVAGGEWFLVGEPEPDGDAFVFRLHRHAPRHSVTGRLTPQDKELGGFYVTLSSFQSEREGHIDRVVTFTDADGSFAVDVLADATYCAWVTDAKWVCNVIDLIPYSSALDKATSPQLSLSVGQDVEVLATIGPDRKPYANLMVHFSQDHDFQWQEDGETRSGANGPHRFATTDEHGRATVCAAPGDLAVSVYTPKWRTEQEVMVQPGQPTQIKLHRESAEPRRVDGQVVISVPSELPPGIRVQVAAIDGFYNDRQQPPCDDGHFSFETLATTVGIYASTADGRYAGSRIASDLQTPVDVILSPTTSYEGRLLDDRGRPLADHRVFAVARVRSDEDFNSPFPKHFEAQRVEVRTDADGNFTLTALPCQITIEIYADNPDGSRESMPLEDILLRPGEQRPRQTLRLTPSRAIRDAAPLSERFPATLRDGALGGFCPVVILFAGPPDVADFVQRNLVAPDANRELSGYMQLLVDCNADRLDDADANFIAERGWSRPVDMHLVARVLDRDGGELDQLDLDIRDPAAAEAVREFVHRHAPPVVDAHEQWADAFETAKRTNRKVWARVSQRYCGPCFRLSRWLDDQHELLAKDYVFLKINDVRDRHGAAVAKRLTQDRRHGVPFHAIFDADGRLIVDSAGPLGNIGYPAGSEGKQHLRNMLLETRSNLTDEEIDRLIASLDE